MMKKKLFSLAVTLVMALSLAVPAMAAPGSTDNATGSITIESTDTVTVDGHDFTAYRVLDLTYDGASAYSYTVNTNFAGFTANEGAVTAENLVAHLSTLGNDAQELKDISYALAQYALTNGIKGETVTGANGEATFNNLPYGYYVIYPHDGTPIVCAIDTVTGEVTINVKNDYPTLEKEVVSIDGEADKTSGNIGDVVGYELTTAKVPDVTGLSAYIYVITDTMSKGLTFQNDVAITIGGIAMEKDVDYTVESSVNDETKATSITITLTNPIAAITKAEDAEGYNAELGIVTTYTAVINRDAEVYNDITNSASLEYGNNDNTVTDEVAIQTYDFDFRKFTDDGSDGKQYTDGDKVLADAEFKLTTTNDKDAAGLTFTLDNGVYYYDKASVNTVLTSSGDGDGIVNVKGLEAGTYYLWETDAPEGYNVIETATVITVGGADDASVVYNIWNGTGAELPSTGGMGTTIFYALGGTLVVAAAVLLITKKRMHNAED